MLNNQSISSSKFLIHASLLFSFILLLLLFLFFQFPSTVHGMPTNLAEGKPYTSSVPASSAYPDTNGIELTDGEYAPTDAFYTDSRYQGRSVFGSYYQTIDLEGDHSISEVFTNFFGGNIHGINFPQEVSYSISTDGTNFTNLGNALPQSQIGYTKKYKIILDTPVTARYVRMTVGTGNSWIFADEIEVLGAVSGNGGGGDDEGSDPEGTLLSDLKVDGVTIDGFNPNKFNYSMILPIGTIQVPVVTAVADDINATISITQAANVTGKTEQRTAKVVVSGDIDTTYKITFTPELVPTGTEPRVNGFFIQPSLGYGATDGWSSFTTQSEHDVWLQNMADVGADMLFYQWTARYEKDQDWYTDVHGGSPNADFAYYDIVNETIDGIPTNNWIKNGMGWLGDEVPPVQRALDAAEKAGIEVWLGLYINEDPDSKSWWNTMSDNVIGTEDQAIIDYHVARTISMANDLYSQYGNHPAFGGFYYSIEVANITFFPEENWPVLANLISEVVDAVHTLDPNVQVAICPFFNTNVEIEGTTLGSPVEFGAMWEYVLENTNLDILILQDGVGVEPLTLSDTVDKITPFFRQVAHAARLNNVEFWGNSELFTNISTDPEPRLHPEFVPGDIEKIQLQLETVADYVDKFVSFEFHYMDPAPNHTFFTPIGGSAQSDAAARLKLYNDYKAYYEMLIPADPSPNFVDPHVTGTFIQPDYADTFDNTNWQIEYEYMKEVGITKLFMQWTADSKHKTTIYPSGVSGYTQETTQDVVAMALTNAEVVGGIDVYLGLQVNDDWWGTAANDTQWINNEANIANQFASDLWSKYGSHPSIKGWYLSFEVDNWRFLNEEDWNRMVGFYNNVTDHLHVLTPDLPVVIAPFYNPSGGLTPSQWQIMWEYILERTSIDVIALQDGVGVEHATAATLPTWFSATKDAIDNVSPMTELWSDAENFTLDWQPMDIDTFVKNLIAVEPFVSNYISFTYNHYTSPQAVPIYYHDTYKQYVTTGIVESEPPTVPSNLSAVAQDSMTINLSWDVSTDNIGVAGYKIYRNGEHVWNIYNSDVDSFVDRQLNYNTSYSYTIRAFDAAGNESGLSNIATGTTLSGPNHPTNLAYGKVYTSTMTANEMYPDTNGTELTDGLYSSSGDYQDAEWQGRMTPYVYSFTIDLGSSQTIKEVVSNWAQNKSATVLLPTSVAYYVSSDGHNFTLLGTVDKPAVADSVISQTYRLNDLNNSGRYIKVEVTPTGWSFIDEIEIRQ